MQKIGMLAFVFMLVVRIAAAISVAIGAIGIMWFRGYYFSGGNLFDAVVAVTPLISLIAGIVIPERLLLHEPGFWGYQALFAMGLACVGISMFRDMSLPNGPDYAAFGMRFFSIGLLLVFVLRAAFIRSTTKLKDGSS